MPGVINLERARVEAQMFSNTYEGARVTSLGDTVKVMTLSVKDGEARFREADTLVDAEWKEGPGGTIVVTGVSKHALDALGRENAAETWVIRPRRCKGCR